MYINVSNKRLSISSEELYSFGGGRDKEGRRKEEKLGGEIGREIQLHAKLLLQ